jgi:serine/threonine protein kinase
MEPEAKTEVGGRSPVSLVGTVIKGRYEVDRELGAGGFGAVYHARDLQLNGREVVVKVMLSDAARDEWFRKKFAHEIQALSRINHRGVVSVVDAGEMDDGNPYMVMGFVAGQSLRKAMKPNEPMPLARASAILRELSKALSAAHDKSVVHRDLKPENIMLNEPSPGEEHPVLIDFGIATVRGDEEGGGQQTKVAGTYAYMAPEQFKGHPSAASDIWALGVIAYEMVTGRQAFPAENLFDIVMQQRTGPKHKPREFCPELPMEAENAILRALSFRESDRFLKAREFGEVFANATSLISSGPTLAPEGVSLAASMEIPKPAIPREKKLELAHVLFVDIVKYSSMPMDKQASCIEELTRVVQSNRYYKQAQQAGALIPLPTGDGMALVFFDNPQTAADCAIDLGRDMRFVGAFAVRMGLNTGPVYRVADINANLNVSGGGINTTQRIMDAGDANHILVGRSMAETLGQLSSYRELLHNLGEHGVKNGEVIELHNLCGADFGNSNWPSALKPAAIAAGAAKGKSLPPRPPEAKSNTAMMAAIGILLVLIAAGIYYVWKGGGDAPSPTAASSSLSYSINVQRFRDGKPYREPFELAKEIVFESGFQIRFAFRGVDDGFLYMINEAPAPMPGGTKYMMLFPTPTANGGSPRLLKGTPVQTAPIQFDDQQGTEKVWLLWSKSEIAELATIRAGLVKSEAEAGRIAALIGEIPRATPATNEVEKRTVLTGAGERWAYELQLMHQ